MVRLGGLVLVVAVGSGVTLRGNSSPDQVSQQRADGVAVFSNEPARSVSTGVFINERDLTPEQVWVLTRTYRLPPPRGRFWYDSISGLYGVWGREAAGYIRPGHNLGPLAPYASSGNTGVFINGRQINWAELRFFQVLFNGHVRPGRIWLDGYTWNMGNEGSAFPLANLAVAIFQQRQSSQQQRYAQGNSWGWRDGSGAVMSSDGNCTMMAVPGAPVYSSGC